MHLLAQKPDYTGSGFYLRALLEEARELGHEVAAVVGLGPDDRPDIPHLFPALPYARCVTCMYPVYNSYQETYFPI